jgi:hypothetical protein
VVEDASSDGKICEGLGAKAVSGLGGSEVWRAGWFGGRASEVRAPGARSGGVRCSAVSTGGIVGNDVGWLVSLACGLGSVGSAGSGALDR